LESIMHILNFQRWKLPPSNFSMTFKDSIWKDDILLNINAKTNTLCFSIQMKCKWGNFKLKNLLMFEVFTWNLSHSIATCHKTKTLQETLKHLKKISCTNLKFDLKLVTFAKNSLWHIWNLKLSRTWKTSLAHTSNVNVETLNNSKNFLHTLWNPKTLWRTLFHTWKLTTPWRSFFHTSHSLGKVTSSLYATTWKWTPTHFAN
jgi:hypothetical protein